MSSAILEIMTSSINEMSNQYKNIDTKQTIADFERITGKKVVYVDDTVIINSKISLLSTWIEMYVTLKIGQELKAKRRSFYFNAAGTQFEIEYFDLQGNNAKPMSFEEFVGCCMVFTSDKLGYHLIYK